MEKQHKLKELHEGIKRWKSHREVHAQPSDAILYEVIEGLLTFLIEVTKEPETIADAPVVNESESIAAPAGDEDGSNPPNGPGTPP